MLGKALLFSMMTTTAASAASTYTQGETAGDSLRITLNIPTYQLEVWDGSERIRSYWVTIGLPEYPTPTGAFSLTRIEWNPGWVPPPSPWARDKTPKKPGKSSPM